MVLWKDLQVVIPRDSMINRLNTDSLIILKNLSYLSFLRFFNIGIKFFLVAYLVRVLGEINYGILIWSDSIIQFF